ncbi:MAG: L,D-transpeptidase [Myxococcota bacterium]|nr:L,D-transpeptidase [Myxococcota bacterium]
MVDRSTYTHLALVSGLSVPLYAKPEKRTVVGYTGITSRVPAIPSEKDCEGGKWLAVTGNAYLCSGDGVRLEKRPLSAEVLEAWTQRRAPNVDRPTPYRSAALRNGAPIFRRAPTASELAQVDQGRTPKVVKRVLNGTLLMAYVRTLRAGPERLLELLSGEFVREKDIDEFFPEPAFRGELLGKEASLPLAFTYQDAPVYCLDGESPEPCGTAAKHARFFGVQLLQEHDQQLLAVGEGLAIPRHSVRIAEKISRPKVIGRKEQWIHIDLTEQTLVAYQGSTPVRATLISTGKEGHVTPRGLYQVNRVYQTKPMNGVDELGPYQVQEVPWTLFFRGNYAMHGAYWHNAFGGPRSHGCVNLPPADARWLYYWAQPGLAEGWTADVRITGPRVYITGETPVEPRPTLAVNSDQTKGSDARPLD